MDSDSDSDDRDIESMHPEMSRPTSINNFKREARCHIPTPPRQTHIQVSCRVTPPSYARGRDVVPLVDSNVRAVDSTSPVAPVLVLEKRGPVSDGTSHACIYASPHRPPFPVAYQQSEQHLGTPLLENVGSSSSSRTPAPIPFVLTPTRTQEPTPPRTLPLSDSANGSGYSRGVGGGPVSDNIRVMKERLSMAWFSVDAASSRLFREQQQPATSNSTSLSGSMAGEQYVRYGGQSQPSQSQHVCQCHLQRHIPTYTTYTPTPQSHPHPQTIPTHGQHQPRILAPPITVTVPPTPQYHNPFGFTQSNATTTSNVPSTVPRSPYTHGRPMRYVRVPIIRQVRVVPVRQGHGAGPGLVFLH
ncbi:hypothetical protein HK102_013810 [Quaeritorhiza haematococci]|nr:hypothetical protein HK102_013810 [Quaeritorhiza haematococci]